jgi:hypothetical protein
MTKNSFFGWITVLLGILLLALALHHRRKVAELRQINGGLVEVARIRREQWDIQDYLDELEQGQP